MNRREDMEGMVDTIMSPTNSSVSSRGHVDDLEDDLSEEAVNPKRKRDNNHDENDEENSNTSPKLQRSKEPSSRDQVVQIFFSK